MSASNVESLASVISAIQSPVEGEGYPVQYAAYLEVVRYVAGLYGQRLLLSHDSGDCSRLDHSVVGTGLVRQAKGFESEKESLLNVDATGDRDGVCHSGVSGVVDKCSVADATGPAIGGSPSVTSLIVPGKPADEGGKKKRRKRTKKRSCACVEIEDGGERGVSGSDVGRSVGNTYGGVNYSRVGFGQIQERGGSHFGISDRTCGNGVRGRVISGQESGVARSVASKRADNFGRLERRSFSPDLVSWRSSDDESDVTDSDEAAARASYWRRKHIENCVAIKRGVAYLEKKTSEDRVGVRKHVDEFERELLGFGSRRVAIGC